MSSRFAFQPEDLAALLALEWAEPADMADIDAIHGILLRRSDPGITDAAPSGRPTLHLVPDPRS